MQGHWAENTIKKWLRQNLVAGYPDGSFKPDQSITRAEFVAIVNRVFNYTQKAVVQFTDLSPEEWYIDDLAKAVAAGYINGYPDGTFRPEQTITRQEVAAILTQIFSLEGTTEELKKFKD
ncbi:MAG: S-layer homology domain-containing protein [Peptococcia bacterium]